jgi:hypothetical protein
MVRQEFTFPVIIREVLSQYGRVGDLFREWEQHFEEMTHGISSHYYSLVKFCEETFLHLRFHHLARLRNEEHERNSRRQLLNKLVLFGSH